MMAPDNYDAVTALGTGDLISYIFSPLFNRAIWKEHDVGKGHNLIMEILLCSDQPSLRSFCNEEGNFEFEGHIEYPFAVDVQEGIMTFTKIFKEHPFREYQISGSDAYAPISLIKNNKKFISELIEISNIRSNLE